jgi:hypothetical protein
MKPNGGDKCMYRHALPPGFVLKADKKAADELAKKEQISLEEFLEVEVRISGVKLRFLDPGKPSLVTSAVL